MRKRKRCYIMNPVAYEISCNLCGGSNITWSEYEHCIWCYDCQRDTIGTEGIFSGPIPFEMCKILGISFDKIDLKTGKRLYLMKRKNRLVWKTT